MQDGRGKNAKVAKARLRWPSFAIGCFHDLRQYIEFIMVYENPHTRLTGTALQY
jgi:hypothetical protein